MKIKRELMRALEENLPDYALEQVAEMVRQYEEKCRELEQLKYENRMLQQSLMGANRSHNGIGFKPQQQYPQQNNPHGYPEIYAHGYPWPYNPMEEDYYVRGQYGPNRIYRQPMSFWPGEIFYQRPGSQGQNQQQGGGGQVTENPRVTSPGDRPRE